MKHNKLSAIIPLCIVVIISLTFTSCGGFFGFDITDQKAIDENLKSKLSEFIPADASVIEIRLHQEGGSTFSTTISGANVTFIDPASNEVQAKWITLSGKAEEKKGIVSLSLKDSDSKVSPADGQKLADIDFSKIAAIVNKAGEKVTAGGNEFSGINGFTIKSNSDPAKVTYEFMIQSRQDAKTTTKSGRLATEISYLEFNFTADAEGNLTEKE